jgi:hypothetical protein
MLIHCLHLSSSTTPSAMSSNPFDTLAKRIRQELQEAMEEQVRAYQRIEGRKGRALAWEQAWTEWTEAHRENFGQFLMLRMR